MLCADLLKTIRPSGTMLCRDGTRWSFVDCNRYRCIGKASDEAEYLRDMGPFCRAMLRRVTVERRDWNASLQGRH